MTHESMTRPGALAGWKRIAAVVLALSAGCTDAICGCSPVDPSFRLVVRGDVVDGDARGIVGAHVSVPRPIDVQCVQPTDRMWTVPDIAVAGADGRFQLEVQTFDGPVEYCMDVVARVPGTALADTLRDVRGRFRPSATTPPDTVTVRIVVGR